MSPSIVLFGDVMLGRGVAEALGRVRPEDVWAPEVREICSTCDLGIANLECCVSERGRPTARVPGKPFFFRAPPAAVESLRAVGVRVAGLANNHALDYETEALEDSLDLLDDAGIARVGAGRNRAEARRGVRVEVDEIRIGVIAVSDHPRSFAAGPGRPGIAYEALDHGIPDWLSNEVETLKGRCDLVIAFPHWGPNMTTEPARWQRRAAVELQEAGADLVAGHSAHVFHGVGRGPRGPLLFDLGDALDDYSVDPVLRNDLGLIAIWRPGDTDAEVELVGLRLEFCYTRLAVGEEADWIARRLTRACGELGTAVERVGEQRFLVRPRASSARPDR